MKEFDIFRNEYSPLEAAGIMLRCLITSRGQFKLVLSFIISNYLLLFQTFGQQAACGSPSELILLLTRCERRKK